MKKTLLTFIAFWVGISSMTAQERIPEKGEMPILAWYSIPDSACSVQRYEELRNAGFTATFPHLNTLAEVERA